MNVARGAHTATLLQSGLVLVAGGLDSSGNALSSAELFDPSTGAFTLTGSLNTARFIHTATLLQDGTVLVAGGTDLNGDTFSSAELFDSAKGTFTPTGSMSSPRVFHTATLLDDGTVRVAGGALLTLANCGINCITFFPVSTATTELFDPSTGSFSPAADMQSSRSGHTATPLPGNMVLVTGGVHSRIQGRQLLSTVLSSAEFLR